jgi:hypothetical protein
MFQYAWERFVLDEYARLIANQHIDRLPRKYDLADVP